MATVEVTESPAIGAIAPWFGGKRTLGETIAAEFGPCRAYWGLCCGSLAVEFAMEPVSMMTCIDMHGDLTNLAFALQAEDTAVELYAKLSRTILSRELYIESARIITGETPPAGGSSPDVERAYHYFVASWGGRNGVSGTTNNHIGFCVRYTKNGGHAATRFTSAVDSVPAWHHLMRRWTILRDDIFKHLPKIEDAEGVVVYIDPPYLKKGAKYLHDFGPQHHVQLAGELQRFKKTRVIVSYYDDARLQEMYPEPKWTIRRLKANKGLANPSKRDESGATEATEVLLINGPSLVSGTGNLFN